MFPNSGRSGKSPKNDGKFMGVVNKIEKKKTSTTEKAPTVSNKTGAPSSNSDKTKDCRFCGRPFTMDRLGVHEVICQRSSKNKKKTKTFLDPYTKSEKEPSSSKQEPLPTGTKWREEHEALIATIRGAKALNRQALAEEKNPSKVPPTPLQPLRQPSTIQCPHCGRRFSKEAGERHIPLCKDYDYNKSKKS